MIWCYRHQLMIIKLVAMFCNVRIVHVWNHRWQFFNIKTPLKMVITYIENTHLTSMTRVNLPFCHTNLTVVRNGGLTALVITFDMALTENEFGPKKIDHNDDLTALVIWPEVEHLLYWLLLWKTKVIHFENFTVLYVSASFVLTLFLLFTK